MQETKIKDIMTKDPVVISPDCTIKEAAMKMKEIDTGVLPVGAEDKLHGMITDRDIVLRVIAEGEDIEQTKVEDIMTPKVVTCGEDESLQKAADTMRLHQVNRLVITDDEGKMCGILSFGGILRKDDNTSEICEVIQHAVGKAA